MMEVKTSEQEDDRKKGENTGEADRGSL